MSNKRVFEDSTSSINSRTIVQATRRRKVESDLEEGEIITAFETLSLNKYEATDPQPYLVYLFDSCPGNNISNYHPVMIGKQLA